MIMRQLERRQEQGGLLNELKLRELGGPLQNFKEAPKAVVRASEATGIASEIPGSFKSSWEGLKSSWKGLRSV